MKKIVAFALLFGLALTQVSIANSTAFTAESSVFCGCDKCGKKDCDGSCDGKEGKKACSKDKKACCKKGEKKAECKKDDKKSCCKKKTCKKKEEAEEKKAE